MKSFESPHNPRFQRWKKWADHPALMQKEGKFFLEGEHLVEMFLENQGEIESLLVQKNKALTVEKWFSKAQEVVLLPEFLLQKLSTLKTPSGVLAIANLPVSDLKINFAQNAVLLDGVQNPLNVGAILRVAAASGFHQILFSPHCARAYSPKALRAAQGAHFLLQLFENADLLSFIQNFKGEVFATTLKKGAVNLFEVEIKNPVAWILGSEGKGVSWGLMEKAKGVHIPMQSGVESLNVASAAALCLFEGLRRKK